jgi:hypothetical protein
LQYLRKVLAPKYNLSFEERDKSVVDVDDVYALLEHHWADDTHVYEDERQRLQTDALILIASYTGSRPGALVYNPPNEKISPATRQEVGELAAMLQDRKWNGITYRFVELWLITAPHSPRGCLFFMRINLSHVKGCGSGPQTRR